MMKQEFEKLIGSEISPENYKTVETVYMYHPLMAGETPKQTIAEIYKIGGIGLIRDMLPTANKFAVLEESVENTRRMYESAVGKYQTALEEYVG